jgi:hypothetical protein
MTCCSEVDWCRKGPGVHYQCVLAGLAEHSHHLHKYVFVCAVPLPAGHAASVMVKCQSSEVVLVLNIFSLQNYEAVSSWHCLVMLSTCT